MSGFHFWTSQQYHLHLRLETPTHRVRSPPHFQPCYALRRLGATDCYVAVALLKVHVKNRILMGTDSAGSVNDDVGKVIRHFGRIEFVEQIVVVVELDIHNQ